MNKGDTTENKNNENNKKTKVDEGDGFYKALENKEYFEDFNVSSKSNPKKKYPEKDLKSDNLDQPPQTNLDQSNNQSNKGSEKVMSSVPDSSDSESKNSKSDLKFYNLDQPPQPNLNQSNNQSNNGSKKVSATAPKNTFEEGGDYLKYLNVDDIGMGGQTGKKHAPVYIYNLIKGNTGDNEYIEALIQSVKKGNAKEIKTCLGTGLGDKAFVLQEKASNDHNNARSKKVKEGNKGAIIGLLCKDDDGKLLGIVKNGKGKDARLNLYEYVNEDTLDTVDPDVENIRLFAEILGVAEKYNEKCKTLANSKIPATEVGEYEFGSKDESYVALETNFLEPNTQIVTNESKPDANEYKSESKNEGSFASEIKTPENLEIVTNESKPDANESESKNENEASKEIHNEENAVPNTVISSFAMWQLADIKLLIACNGREDGAFANNNFYYVKDANNDVENRGNAFDLMFKIILKTAKDLFGERADVDVDGVKNDVLNLMEYAANNGGVAHILNQGGQFIKNGSLREGDLWKVQFSKEVQKQFKECGIFSTINKKDGDAAGVPLSRVPIEVFNMLKGFDFSEFVINQEDLNNRKSFVANKISEKLGR